MWKWFLHLRLNRKSQYEIRLVAAEICEQLYEIAPIIFENDFDKLDDIGL